MSKTCDSCGEHLPDDQFRDGDEDCYLCRAQGTEAYDRHDYDAIDDELDAQDAEDAEEEDEDE